MNIPESFDFREFLECFGIQAYLLYTASTHVVRGTVAQHSSSLTWDVSKVNTGETSTLQEAVGSQKDGQCERVITTQAVLMNSLRSPDALQNLPPSLCQD